MGVKVETVEYVSQGERVRALLFVSDARPPFLSEPGGSLAEGPLRRPTIVLAPGRDRDVRALEWLARPLAEAGFIVLGTQYRDGQTQVHQRDIEDVGAALSFLSEWESVDPSRLGLIGHSRGAIAVLNVAARHERIRTVVALAPVTDHIRYVQGMRQYSPSRYEAMIKMRGGTPDEVPDYYRAVSPIHWAANITAPVLLIHGTLDLVVPMEHSQWMKEALERAGHRSVRLELLPQVGHFFERKFSGYAFEDVVSLCLDWLRETLGTPMRGREGDGSDVGEWGDGLSS